MFYRVSNGTSELRVDFRTMVTRTSGAGYSPMSLGYTIPFEGTLYVGGNAVGHDCSPSSPSISIASGSHVTAGQSLSIFSSYKTESYSAEAWLFGAVCVVTNE